MQICSDRSGCDNPNPRPFTDFDKDSRKKSGYRTQCKICRSMASSNAGDLPRNAYLIRKCPSGSAWASGHYLVGQQFEDTLKAGYLVPGMVVEYHNKTYVVEGEPMEPQKLVPA